MTTQRINLQDLYRPKNRVITTDPNCTASVQTRRRWRKTVIIIIGFRVSWGMDKSANAQKASWHQLIIYYFVVSFSRRRFTTRVRHIGLYDASCRDEPSWFLTCYCIPYLCFPQFRRCTMLLPLFHNSNMFYSLPSQHDKGPNCVSSNHKGNYIMFDKATSGNRPNNRKFSSCSIDSISTLVNFVLNAEFNKENCFLSMPFRSPCGAVSIY